MLELVDKKMHIVIKRDGREEPFSEEKLRKIINWAADKKEVYTDAILNNMSLKIKDKIKITDLYDDLIRTTSNMISPLYPIYDTIAEKLYTMKIYKETCGLKKSGEYPHLQTFLDKGIKYKIYDKKVISHFSKEDIEYLNKCLVPDRDFIYPFKGIVLMFDKYCKKYKRKQFELPQITYMVAAMYSFYDDYLKEGSKNAIKKSRKLRLELIKINYDLLSLHYITFATPRIANSMTIKAQLASCVLNTPADDTWSLNQTDGNMAVYSKFSGGIAYDASYIRASGSLIHSNSGVSDGPVPFIKRTEQTISSFNQQGKRKGAAVITFPWWHLDVLDLIMLKDAGGTEETRARKLVYAMRISNILRKRVLKDEEITLFDPKETPLLNETFGKEFDKNYLMYEQKTGIRKKKIKAKELIFKYLKVRTETGNLYSTFVDNINEQNMRNVFVGASNLCVSGDTLLLNINNKGERNWNTIENIVDNISEVKDSLIWDGFEWALSKVFFTGYQKTYTIKVCNSIYVNEENSYLDFNVSGNFTSNHLWVNASNGKSISTEHLCDYLIDSKGHFYLPRYNISIKDLKLLFYKLHELKKLEEDYSFILRQLQDFKDDCIVSVLGTIYYEDQNFEKSYEIKTYCLNVPTTNMTLFNGIYNHNCQEICVPSSPSKLVSEKVYKSENGTYEIHRVLNSGEIGICNLVSINLVSWVKLSNKDKFNYMYTLLRGCDNVIDTQFYPAIEGSVSNKKNRPIGIGVTNYANLLASNKLKYTDEATKQFTFDVFEDLYYYVYLVSNKLAQEKGAYETFKHDKWAQGLTPVHISKFNYKKFGLVFKNKKRWDELGKNIKKYGIRFSLHGSIAPTACMTKDTEITELDNVLSLGDFLIKWGIDVNSIEEEGIPRWVYFEENNKPVINTRFGKKELNRAWYNGKQKVRIIEFEDGSKIKVTLNHPLLVKDRGWIKAKDLKEDDDIVEIGDGCIIKIKKIVDSNELYDTWDLEIPDVHEYILGNGCISHNTSGRVAGMTESIEPIVDLFFTEEGSYTLPALAPNLKENRQYYQRCWEIPSKVIIELAAIRQMFIDQSQSLNLYYIKPESAKELWKDIEYAMDLGLKTLYYMKTPKSNFELEEVCESCT